MRVMLSRSTPQSIPASTWTSVNWPVADEASDSSPGSHSSTNLERIVMQFGPRGAVLLTAQIFWASSGTGIRGLGLIKDGTTTIAEAAISASTVATGPLNLARLALADPSTYFHCEVWQNSGGSLDLEPVGSIFTASHVSFG